MAWKLFKAAVLVSHVAGVAANLHDIKRYIRISRM
jgi:hypothetical protein